MTQQALQLVDAIEDLQAGGVEAGQVDGRLDARGAHADAVAAGGLLVVALCLARPAHLAGRVGALPGVKGRAAGSRTFARAAAGEVGGVQGRRGAAGISSSGSSVDELASSDANGRRQRGERQRGVLAVSGAAAARTQASHVAASAAIDGKAGRARAAAAAATAARIHQGRSEKGRLRLSPRRRHGWIRRQQHAQGGGCAPATPRRTQVYLIQSNWRWMGTSKRWF